jgi:hypothetical protein
MARSDATTVPAYLESLPPPRREVVDSVLAFVRRHVPEGYEEVMAWGMVCWQVPLARYPHTYNKQALTFAALAAQKNHYALYLSCVTEHSRFDATLRQAYAKAGRKLDMGKACLRFKSGDDLLLDAIAPILQTPVDEFLRDYEAGHHSPR